MGNYHHVSRESPCPICWKPDWCSIDQDGTVLCHRDTGRGVKKTDKNGAFYWVHKPDGAGADWRATKYEAPVLPDIASPEVLNKVYSYVLGQLSLSEPHRQNLQQRGFSAEAMGKHGFLSAVANASHLVAKSAAEQFPDVWTKVPGLSLKDGEKGSYPSFGVVNGILIPVKNEFGQVVALRLRRDEAKDKERYFWLSSSGKKGGPGPGSPVGVWGWKVGDQAPDTVRICEGEFKAALSLEKTGTPALSAPGVSQMGSPRMIQLLQVMGAKKVFFAPDADALTKKDVGRPVRSAIHRLQDAGFVVSVDSWESSDKGIDDALVAGCEIGQMSPAEYLDQLAIAFPEVTNEPKAPFRSENFPQLERALLAIGGECDGASTVDGVGFNSKDTDFFAMHLDTVRKGQQIAVKFRAKVLDRLSKYGGQLLQLGFNLNEISAEEDAKKAELKEKGESEKEQTQAQILLEMTEDWELIRWQGQFYASFLVENQGERKGTYRRETHRFSRAGVRAQLYYAFKKREGYPPNSEAIASAVMSLESDAQFEGQDREIFIRTAHHEGKFYIDLQDGLGTAVCISETGWELTNDPPVLFVRPIGSASLPYPEKGGSLEGFRKLLGLEGNAWILVVSWLVFSLTPIGPFPVLLLEAAAGSAKSTFARMLNQLVDPSQHDLRGKPADEEALVVQACNNWCLVLDNLTQLSEGISNLLCRISTKGSISKRKHHSNDEEHVITIQRPVILTGIVGVVTKPDLGERIVKISPPLIPDHKRRREREVWAEFEPMRAQIFGCLLDAIAAGLRNSGKVKLPSLPRMAELGGFICEAEEALPWEPGSFIKAFKEFRDDQVECALEGDPVANACRQLVALNGSWRGTPTELRERLGKLVLREESLPSVIKLSHRIQVLQPYLTQVDVNFNVLRVRGVRVLELSRKSALPEGRGDQPSPPSPNGEKPHNQTEKEGDGWGDGSGFNCHPGNSTVTPTHKTRVTVDSQGDGRVTVENGLLSPCKSLSNKDSSIQGDEGDGCLPLPSGSDLFSDVPNFGREVGEV